MNPRRPSLLYGDSLWVWGKGGMLDKTHSPQFPEAEKREGEHGALGVHHSSQEIHPEQWKKPLRMVVTGLSQNQVVTLQRLRTTSLGGPWALGGLVSLGQGWANFSCNGPDNKYFRPWGHKVSNKFTQLCLAESSPG